MISPVKTWRRQKETRKILGKQGKIIASTTIFIAGINFKKNTPYPVVLVEFSDKKKAFGQLVDFEENDLQIGQPVIAVLRKVRDSSDESIIAYGIKFRPV